MSDLVVTLFEEVREDIKIQVFARITEDGGLMIDGVDSGELVEKLKGDWDYEYYLTLSKSNKELLIQRLENKNILIIDDRVLLDWIKTNHSGNGAYSSFQGFLTTENIEFKMDFWV